MRCRSFSILRVCALVFAVSIVVPVVSAAVDAPVAPVASQDVTCTHWLNTASKVRHNSACHWFQNTKKGRCCTPSEGKACGKCGG